METNLDKESQAEGYSNLLRHVLRALAARHHED
jgi:hypothetical protein